MRVYTTGAYIEPRKQVDGFWRWVMVEQGWDDDFDESGEVVIINLSAETCEGLVEPEEE